MDFQLLFAHCQKYGLAHTHADLARALRLSGATIHEMATGKFAPSLSNLARMAVTCEVSLAGLICPALWKTSASGSKIEARTAELPVGSTRKFYDWDEIEQQVIALIESGNAKPPYTMAKEMGLCEKQFCLKLGKTIYRLRFAALNKRLLQRDQEYEEIKAQLIEKIKFAKQNGQTVSLSAMRRKLGIGVNKQLFLNAYSSLRYKRLT